MCRLFADGYGQHLELVPVLLVGGRPARVRALKARASSQTRCHFGSICLGSYLSISPQRRKSLSRERPGNRRGLAAVVPALSKELRVHRAILATKPVCALFRYTRV